MWQKVNCLSSQKLTIVSSNTEEGLDTQWDFSKINHILGSKISLNKHQKNEITSWILSEHQRLMLPDNTKDRKFMSLWQFSNTCWTTIGWKEKSRKKWKFLLVKENKNTIFYNLWNKMKATIWGSLQHLEYHETWHWKLSKNTFKNFFLCILKCFYIFE